MLARRVEPGAPELPRRSSAPVRHARSWSRRSSSPIRRCTIGELDLAPRHLVLAPRELSLARLQLLLQPGPLAAETLGPACSDTLARGGGLALELLAALRELLRHRRRQCLLPPRELGPGVRFEFMPAPVEIGRHRLLELLASQLKLALHPRFELALAPGQQLLDLLLRLPLVPRAAGGADGARRGRELERPLDLGEPRLGGEQRRLGLAALPCGLPECRDLARSPP